MQLFSISRPTVNNDFVESSAFITILPSSEGGADIGSHVTLPCYTPDIWQAIGECDGENTMMRTLFCFPSSWPPSSYRPRSPALQWTRRRHWGFSTQLWKEDDVGDKKCHFTQRSPDKCDKYCHVNTVGIGITTRYGK